MWVVSDERLTEWEADNPALRGETASPTQSREDITMRMLHNILHEIKMACILFANAFPERPCVYKPTRKRWLSRVITGCRHQPIPHGAEPGGK